MALEEKGEAGCGKFEWDLLVGQGESTREREESGLTSGFWLSQQKMMDPGREQICERSDKIRERRSQGVKPSRERRTRQDEKGAGMTWQTRAVLDSFQRKKPTPASQILRLPRVCLL